MWLVVSWIAFGAIVAAVNPRHHFQPSESSEVRVAVSTCAKCDGHTFERGTVTPIGEQRKVSVLQCANCGTVIGALDLLVLEGLQRQIAEIDAGFMRIVKALSEA